MTYTLDSRRPERQMQLPRTRLNWISGPSARLTPSTARVHRKLESPGPLTPFYLNTTPTVLAALLGPGNEHDRWLRIGLRNQNAHAPSSKLKLNKVVHILAMEGAAITCRNYVPT